MSYVRKLQILFVCFNKYIFKIYFSSVTSFFLLDFYISCDEINQGRTIKIKTIIKKKICKIKMNSAENNFTCISRILSYLFVLCENQMNFTAFIFIN